MIIAVKNGSNRPAKKRPIDVDPTPRSVFNDEFDFELLVALDESFSVNVTCLSEPPSSVSVGTCFESVFF